MRAVDRFGLLDVEARRVGQHVVDVEVLNQLLHGEDVLVSGEAPAKQGQVVQQALGDEAAVPEQEQVGLRVALGELLIALAHDVGQVAEDRHVAGHTDVHEGPDQHHLAGRGGQQVLAAEHVGDAHEGVVHRVDQGVQRGAVGADNDVVRDAAGLEGDVAADHVSESNVLVGHPDAQHRLAALGLERGELLLREVAVEVVVPELRVAAGRPVAGFDLFRRGVALVGVAGVYQLGHDVLVEVQALRLAVGLVRAAEILSRIAAELALFAGVGFLLFAVNDLVVDLIYFARRTWRFATSSPFRPAYASY